ncbi:hypothetical protein Tco_1078830 [Tanacetum coccineum]|uniref:Uncharacterized protein n=1 Tax=Tanacetum coccineum TaxID=301880 RepID=A0ABQ5HRR7_9ASTR
MLAALKNELRKLTGNNVNTKFAKSSILGKPVLQPHRNQSVVRQLTAFKYERLRISKPRFDSQVVVNNDLSTPITIHYLPKEKEFVVVKPHHVIVSGKSRNSSKNMLRFSSNDMVHNYYLDKARKKTQKGTSINVQEEQNLDLSAGTPFNLKKERIKTWIKDNVISERPRLHGTTLIQEISARQSSQGIRSLLTSGSSKLNLPDHRYKRRCCSLILVDSDSLPHAHAQTTKTYYKHQDSRIKKAQELKTKTSANSDIKDTSSKTKLRGRLLESFQDDAKYEHVGQDTRSQDGKDDKDKQGKDLKISKSNTKSKDNDKGSRSKITQHEGTSLQHNKDQRLKNSTTKQSQQVQRSKIQDLTLRIRRPHIRGDC